MKQALIIIIAFCAFTFIGDSRILKEFLKPISSYSRALYVFLHYAIQGVFPLIAMFLLYKRKEILELLGLSKGLKIGWAMGLVCTLPMFIGYAIIGEFNRELTLDSFLVGILIAGTLEELFYRGFLFGLLFRTTKLGFISAVLISSLPFGLAHLYQGHDLMSSLMAALMTGIGGVYFCWVYVEWNYNLWCSMSLHVFMNMSWILFSVSNTAAGDIGANVFRIMSIALVIALTVVYKKHNSLPYQVNLRTLWRNNNNIKKKYNLIYP